MKLSRFLQHSVVWHLISRTPGWKSRERGICVRRTFMPRKSLDFQTGVWHPSNAHAQIPFSGWNKQATDFAGTCSTVRGRTKKQGWRWMCTSAREAELPQTSQSPSYIRGVGGVSFMKIPGFFRYPGRGSVLLPSRECMSSGNKKRCQKWHQGKRTSLFLPFFFCIIKKEGAISGTLIFLPSLMRKEVHHPVAAGPFLPRQIPVPQ